MTDPAASNFATTLRDIAAAVEPGRPALVHGDRTIDWQALDRQTDAIATGLLARGLRAGDVARARSAGPAR